MRTTQWHVMHQAAVTSRHCAHHRTDYTIIHTIEQITQSYTYRNWFLSQTYSVVTVTLGKREVKPTPKQCLLQLRKHTGGYLHVLIHRALKIKGVTTDEWQNPRIDLRKCLLYWMKKIGSHSNRKAFRWIHSQHNPKQLAPPCSY